MSVNFTTISLSSLASYGFYLSKTQKLNNF